MEDFTSLELCTGVNIGVLRDNRFKTGRTSMAFFLPLTEQMAAATSLLSNVLTRTCKRYTNYMRLNQKLAMLYGSSLYSNSARLGDNLVLMFSGVGINDRYTFDKTDVFSQLTDLLCSMVFEPNLKNGLFDKEDIERERRQVLEEIEAEYNDKRRYAAKRCVQIMCEGEPYACPPYGSADAVKNMSVEELTQEWKEIIDTARVELTMMGETDPKNVIDTYSSFFADKPRAGVPFAHIEKPVENLKRVCEEQDIAQSKMFMGFRCDFGDSIEDYLAAIMMSAVLGGIPMSKLFVNVREKMSLCYYCTSGYIKEKKILMVDSGVETKNLQRAEEEILKQLKCLQDGEVSKEETEAARLALSNSLISHLDSLSSLEKYYIKNRPYGNYISPANMAQKLDDITTEHIVTAARRVSLDTIYTLKGREGEAE